MKNMLLEAAWKADNGTITFRRRKYVPLRQRRVCAVDTAMQVLGGVGVAGNHRITRLLA